MSQGSQLRPQFKIEVGPLHATIQYWIQGASGEPCAIASRIAFATSLERQRKACHVAK